MHSLADLVRLKDRAVFFLGKKLGEYLITNWDQQVAATGYVKLCGLDDMHRVVRGTRREGHNVCTTVGREWLSRLMTYQTQAVLPSQDVAERDDRIRYIGVGAGVQDEVPGVTGLVTPLKYRDNDFLAEVSSHDFPLTSSVSSSTAVRYSLLAEKTDISILGTQAVSELGLFTCGSPGSDYAPRTRSISHDDASDQPPMFYKSFEAFNKTQKFSMAVSWDVRF